MRKVRTPIFPTYSDVRHLLRILPGVPRVELMQMMSDIMDQTGTPQNPVDWSEPDTWIAERLTGASAMLAERIWAESGRELNPRYTRGPYFLINGFGLLAPDGNGVNQLTSRGRGFLHGDPEVVREIDEAEGIPDLLSMLATKTSAMRGDLLPEWGAFLREVSKFGTASTIKDTLRRRVTNLVERGFIARDGNTYSITPAGIDYAASFAKSGAADPKREVMRAINTFNQAQQQALRELLGELPPYQFEHLVRDLLEAMGYEDVKVTKQSGDRGVDVVATVQFGITTVTEVVQVKRHKGSINRPVLDQLRGALPYHEAIRGTIITLGTFTKGCKEVALYPGAAPITLIDGDRLLELLVRHEIGIQKRPAHIYELDEAYLQPDEPVGAAIDLDAEEVEESLSFQL
jgi:restriction system protein